MLSYLSLLAPLWRAVEGVCSVLAGGGRSSSLQDLVHATTCAVVGGGGDGGCAAAGGGAACAALLVLDGASTHCDGAVRMASASLRRGVSWCWMLSGAGCRVVRSWTDWAGRGGGWSVDERWIDFCLEYRTQLAQQKNNRPVNKSWRLVNFNTGDRPRQLVSRLLGSTWLCAYSSIRTSVIDNYAQLLRIAGLLTEMSTKSLFIYTPPFEKSLLRVIRPDENRSHSRYHDDDL